MRELAELRKGDERKALLAAVLRRRTAVATQWIAQRLAMGHPGSVSRQVGMVKSDPKLLKKLNELEKMCHCGDPGDGDGHRAFPIDNHGQQLAIHIHNLMKANQ